LTVAQIALLMVALTSDCPYCSRDADPVEFQKASEFYSVDADLLVHWAYFESSLNSKAIGKRGEVGLFQVWGQHRKACEDANLSPHSVACGAMLIASDTYYCGSLVGGLNRYASGKCEGTPASIRKVKYRLFKMARKLKESKP
jgi:hypothetical protein